MIETVKIAYKEVWPPERRQYVLDQLDKGRSIPDIARELLVAPATLRSALRYHGQLKTKSPDVKYHKHTGNNVWTKHVKTKQPERRDDRNREDAAGQSLHKSLSHNDL
jgi:hypothetical protein